MLCLRWHGIGMDRVLPRRAVLGRPPQRSGRPLEGRPLTRTLPPCLRISANQWIPKDSISNINPCLDSLTIDIFSYIFRTYFQLVI